MTQDTSGATPAAEVESLLKQRYPTLLAVVDELRAGGEHPRLRRWVETTRQAVAQAQSAQKSTKKKSEAERVQQAVELAAAIALQIAVPSGPEAAR